MLPDSQVLFYAFLGGILPALFWLWFWLREDAARPEPKPLILASFLVGMMGVIVVYPLEEIAHALIAPGALLITVWAAIEEIVKYLAILFVALQTRFFDEPIDALIYMITVALGFAALENALFIFSPLSEGDILGSLLTGNLRFMGSTLLHVVASGAVGVMLALAFYRSAFARHLALLVGLGIAIGLHALFNFFIIRNEGQDTFIVFLILWFAVIVLIALFEYIKRIKPASHEPERS